MPVSKRVMKLAKEFRTEMKVSSIICLVGLVLLTFVALSLKESIPEAIALVLMGFIITTTIYFRMDRMIKLEEKKQEEEQEEDNGVL